MDELEALRLRDEVLQALYWMQSEGIANASSASALAGFLAIEQTELTPYLERFAADGVIVLGPVGYSLSERGRDLGKRSFAAEFADLTKPGHGECDDDCDCHESPEAAADCLAERTSHAGA